eukprot:7379138-Prymnesium_polylepis.1
MRLSCRLGPRSRLCSELLKSCGRRLPRALWTTSLPVRVSTSRPTSFPEPLLSRMGSSKCS